MGGWVGGPVILVPLRGSILQAETCQILSLAENPRWSPSVAIPNFSFLGSLEVAQVYLPGWVGVLTVIIIQVSVQIGLDWN